jgi:hypothetical protein
MIREIQAVLDEFSGDPSAMATEIIRLRTSLEQAKLNESISRAQRPPTVAPPQR